MKPIRPLAWLLIGACLLLTVVSLLQANTTLEPEHWSTWDAVKTAAVFAGAALAVLRLERTR